MSRSKNALVVLPSGIAVVLLTAAFASDAPALPLPPPSQLNPGGRAEPFGPATPVRATLFREPASAAAKALTEADLATSLDRAPAAKARALFEAGRFSDALAALPEEEAKSPPERFLRNLAMLRAGRAAEAAPAFIALADQYPALADRCLFHAGQAYERAGDFASAMGAFDAVEEGSLLHVEAQFALAETLRRAGDLRASATVWAPLSDRPAPPWGWDLGGDALFEMASVQEASGQRKAAAAGFLKVWAEHAASKRADKALERAEAMGAAPTPEQSIAHAEGLMEAHKNQQAVSAISPLVEAPPAKLSAASLCRARYVLGKSLRKLRQHAKAVEVLETVVRDCQSETDVWARSLYVAGVSATFVRPEQAIRYYRILAQELPDSPLADDALFDMADLLSRAGRPVQARIALQRLVKMYPDGDSRAEGLFRLFWLERSQGKPERALRALERLAREYRETDSVSAERALYWRGRTLVGMGRTEEGMAAYEQLVLRHPASFYSILARSRLAEQAPQRAAALAARLVAPEPARMSLPLGVLEGDRHLAAAIELLKMGMNEQARDELMGIERAKLRAADGPESLRVLVTLMGRTGEIRIAHAIARNELRADLSGTVDPGTAQVWRVAYPLAFREPLETHAAEAGVDPDLLQALIREESALDPKIHSWAGAIGLCQLMPGTAWEVAGWLKIPGPITAARLHDPDLNLQLGATYLGRLIKQFKGNVALSLASYNAGAGAVGRWVAAAGPRDLDEFIEEIPVTETRNYVKRVLKSYASYQYVYGRAANGARLGQTLVASK
ncbi:MAG TPA: transglycosylase SLT domain-containing protein [Myxococcales bacterium]|jgi:soluble lytic murein transglycosylase